MRSVLEFGACGDGITKDTAAVQRALDAGGTIVFPAGTYLCGTLYLKSYTTLHLEAGATLLASPDPSDYNADDFCAQNRCFAHENVSGAHFIVAVEQKHIAIEGQGRIDGNRQAFYEPPADWKQIWSMKIKWRPGQMIFFCECEHVTITGVELNNSPYWTCFLHGCEQVQIRGVRIWNHAHTRNGDGFDIDCCRFVNLSDCLIDCGDDCITLRGNDEPLKVKRACEFVTITNCVMRTICNAFRIGVGSGVVRNCMISNCIIYDSIAGITFSGRYTENSKGVEIENIQFENIRVDADRPINIMSNAWGRRLGKAERKMRNLSFHHIRGSGKFSCGVVGNIPDAIENISFDDVELDYLPGAVIDPEHKDIAMGNPSAPAPYYFENVRGIQASRLGVNWKTDDPAWRYGIMSVNCSGVRITDNRTGKPVSGI